MSETRQIRVRLPDELRAWLDAECEAKMIGRSALVRIAIQEWLNRAATDQMLGGPVYGDGSGAVLPEISTGPSLRTNWAPTTPGSCP